MLVLALDTTTRAGSAALRRDGVTLDVEVGDAALTHGARLPGDLIRLLGRRQVAIGDVDLFGVAVGPGSFTGLRVGIATMQGLALAGGRRMAAVPALDALAVAIAGPDAGGEITAAWMDAQRGQVFSALYRGTMPLEPAIVDDPAVVLERWRARPGDEPIAFVGDGALRYAEDITRTLRQARITAETPPLAPAVAMLAEQMAARGRHHHAGCRSAHLSPKARRRARSRPPPGGGRRTAMTWVIERTLSEADLSEILEIEKASFSNPWTRQMYLRELQNPDVSFLYVLRVEEGSGWRMAGFCSFWLVLDEIHINNLAVRSEHQGRGFGTALLTHVLEAGASRGAERATLEVRPSNASARRLYERLGFSVAATRPNYYASPPEDALILWKRALSASRSTA